MTNGCKEVSSEVSEGSPRTVVPGEASMGQGQELHQLKVDNCPAGLDATVSGASGVGGSTALRPTSSESSQPHSPKPVNSRLASLRRLQPPSNDINGSVGGFDSSGPVIASPLNIDLGGTIFASDAEIGNLIEQISGFSKRSRPAMASMMADGGLESTTLKSPNGEAGLGM